MHQVGAKVRSLIVKCTEMSFFTAPTCTFTIKVAKGHRQPRKIFTLIEEACDIFLRLIKTAVCADLICFSEAKSRNGTEIGIRRCRSRIIGTTYFFFRGISKHL